MAVTRSFCWLLAVALVVVGAGKWFAAHPTNAVVTVGIARVVGAVEVGMASLLLADRWVAAVCAGVLCMCLVGLGIHLAFPGRPCGCVGAASAGWHLSLMALLGCLASSVLASMQRDSAGRNLTGEAKVGYPVE